MVRSAATIKVYPTDNPDRDYMLRRVGDGSLVYANSESRLRGRYGVMYGSVFDTKRNSAWPHHLDQGATNGNHR